MSANPHESAFPFSAGTAYEPQCGLTKREYFAAMAMQGQMANAEILVRYGLYAADIASAAVAQADALIAALNAEPQS